MNFQQALPKAKPTKLTSMPCGMDECEGRREMPCTAVAGSNDKTLRFVVIVVARVSFHDPVNVLRALVSSFGEKMPLRNEEKFMQRKPEQ